MRGQRPIQRVATCGRTRGVRHPLLSREVEIATGLKPRVPLPFGTVPGPSAGSHHKAGLGSEPLDHGCGRRRVVHVDEPALDAVADHFGDAAGAGRKHRPAAGKRLHHRVG